VFCPDEFEEKIFHDGKGHNVCFSEETECEYPQMVKGAYRRFCEEAAVAVEIAMIVAQKGLVSAGETLSPWGSWTPHQL